MDSKWKMPGQRVPEMDPALVDDAITALHGMEPEMSFALFVDQGGAIRCILSSTVSSMRQFAGHALGELAKHAEENGNANIAARALLAMEALGIVGGGEEVTKQ